jgi:predicted N-acetyltransferase YhbS
MNDITLRPMTDGDLPAVDQLRQLASWNQTPDDWRRLLQLEPDGCFVALLEGGVVGTVTTTRYGSALAWIGMMLVHPECRRQGIATRLMKQALDYLHGRGVVCVGLDATPAGYPVYEKLGFAPESTLARWQSDDVHFASHPEGVAGTRPLREGDWPAVEAMDRAAFGVPRGRLLRVFAQASRVALVWPAHGPVVGWGLLRPGARADYLGPLACSDREGSLALALTLLQKAENCLVFWDIPDANAPAQQMAQRVGFAQVRPFTRMYLGTPPVPTTRERVSGIVDPAVG